LEDGRPSAAPFAFAAAGETIVPVIDQEREAVELRPEEVDDPTRSKWRLGGGDEIVPGLSAIKRLGGGFRYEAYLAWDDRLHSLVVAKVVRPGLVDDEHTLRGLASEIEMLERLNHPVCCAASAQTWMARARTWSSSTSRDRGCRRCCASTGRYRLSSCCPSACSTALRSTT
jgi:hypothetical protein